MPAAETEGDGSGTGSCEGAVPAIVVGFVDAVAAGRVGSDAVVVPAGAAARPPRRPGVSGGHTTSASDSAVVAVVAAGLGLAAGLAVGLDTAAEASCSTRLRARRERRRGSEPEALAPPVVGTALVDPVVPVVPEVPVEEAGLG